MRSIACPVAHVRAPLISSRGSQAHRYMIRVEGMSKAEGVRKHGRGDECPVIQEGYQPPFGDKISMDTRDIRVVSLTTGEVSASSSRYRSEELSYQHDGNRHPDSQVDNDKKEDNANRWQWYPSNPG